MSRTHHTQKKGFTHIFARERYKTSKAISDKIISLSGIKIGSRVLDLGCGPGLISEQILNVIGKEGYLVALDVSEEMVKIAASRLKGNQNVLVLQGDATNLTKLLLSSSSCSPSIIKNRSGAVFTAVVASDVWHQLEDRSKVISEISKSIHKEGILCIADHVELLPRSEEGQMGRSSVDEYLSKRLKLNELVQRELRLEGEEELRYVGKPAATREELEVYKDEIIRGGFSILRVEEDTTLADVNEMVYALPRIIASDICETYPELMQEEVLQIAEKSFKTVFGNDLNPIATEVFITAKLL
jgi:SAM-dependent methyltransferase